MRTVAELMTEPVLVERSNTIQDAAARMLDARVEAAIVTDGGSVQGLVTAEDVARALAEGHDTTVTPVEAIFDPDPQLIRPDEPIAEVHERMRAEHRTIAIAIGPHREPVGVLSDLA